MEGVRGLGPVLRRALLPDLRRVDVGWRLAQPARQQPRPRLRLRRLRRLGGRARHGRHRRARGCGSARRSHRQVRARRQAADAGGPQHPDGTARLFRPAVRVVRVQRRLDVLGHRPALHRGRSEHRDRGRVRCNHRDGLLHAADGQARPRHDGQRHARRSRGDHGTVCVRAAVGGGGDRFHRRGADRRVGVLHRAQGHRRPGGGDLGARSGWHLRGAVRRHLRRRPLRRRMEPDRLLGHRGQRGHGDPVRQREVPRQRLLR